MKLLIVGSRSINTFDLTKYISSDVTLIISGGASGVDRLAESYADKKGVSKLIIRPNYKKYGKRAPLVRNKEMVDICDALLVIWDEKSRGTKFTIDYAIKSNKQITVITYSPDKT